MEEIICSCGEEMPIKNGYITVIVDNEAYKINDVDRPVCSDCGTYAIENSELELIKKVIRSVVSSDE